MAENLSFSPLPFFSNAHRQTFLAAIPPLFGAPPSSTHTVNLPDGDKVTAEISTPNSWKDGDRTVLMLHGLCGSDKSPYLVRMARLLHKHSIRAVRVNYRGCGTGRGLAKKPYHGGSSEDILHIIQDLKKATPFSPFTLVGFSLGGNIALKLGGEISNNSKLHLEQIIAICAPTDLSLSSKLISHSNNFLYEKIFLSYLLREVSYRERFFPETIKTVFPKKVTMFQFDELYTSAQCGFAGAYDYYEKCSSKSFIPYIKTPCRILFAEDDPLIFPHSLDNSSLPTHIKVWKTKMGGHLGFISSPFNKQGFYWLDTLLLQWIVSPE